MTTKNPGQADGRPDDGRQRIPVVEEHLVIDRRLIEGRTVGVTTRPASEDVMISELLAREEVTVERVPVGRVIDAVPAIREEPDLVVIPVVEERARVVADLVLTEEIHLRRTVHQERHEESVALRHTKVDITTDEG